MNDADIRQALLAANLTCPLCRTGQVAPDSVSSAYNTFCTLLEDNMTEYLCIHMHDVADLSWRHTLRGRRLYQAQDHYFQAHRVHIRGRGH